MNDRPVSKQRMAYFWAAYVVPMVVLDLIWAVLNAVNPGVDWLTDIGMGWGLAQFLIVLALLAFTSRSWVLGWLIFCLLVYLIGAIYQFFPPIEARSSQLEYLIQFTKVQFGVLACFVPLAAMRTLRGWSWGQVGRPAGVLQAIKVEDWFLFSFILCSSLALTRVAQARVVQTSANTELTEFGAQLLMTTLLVIPLYAISFTEQPRGRLFLKWLATMAMLLAFVALGLYGEGTLERDFPRALIMVGAFGIAYVWGALSILACGWRLVQLRKTLAANGSKGDLPANDVAASQSALARRQARLTTGAAAALIGIGLTVHYLDESRQLAFYTSIQQPNNYYQAAVESVDLRGPKIVGVKMSPTATDADLIRVIKLTPHIERLVLSHTQITDKVLAKLKDLPKLKWLDLSHTSVTGAGLENLPSDLQRLSLAHTHIDFQSVVQYANRARELSTLDVSYCQIDDDQLGLFKDSRPPFFNRLSLAGNPISDDGVASMLDRGTIFHLDLSDTPTEGLVLAHANCPSSVSLDGTNITDSQLNVLAKPGWRCETLSLRRTQISSAVLPTLSSRGMSLELGGGLITEQDLLGLSSGSFAKLALNGPEFTGECLTTGRIAAAVIDLQHSKVTDEILAKLFIQAYIYSLNVSHTNVSQNGWASIDIHEIEASDSLVNYQSLLKNRPLCSRVILRHEQLTPEELLKTNRTGVIFDEESFLAY